jgi:lipoyl(octanoyl) transferase
VGRPLEVTYLGRVEYDDGLVLQEELRERVHDGRVPDQLLLLEHSPVITLGRNHGRENVLLSEDELARRGIGLYESGRGGDVTYHGPGQVVGYPVVDLKPDRRDVHRYVRDLEEVIIRTLADWGVASGRIPGLTGVWIGDLKIAAIGVRISRWVTTHGFAFNVGRDLENFRTIVPCGIRERGVTSLSRVLREDVPLPAVKERLAAHFADVFDRTAVTRDLSSRTVQCWLWRRSGSGIEVLLLRRIPAEGGFWQPVTGIIEPGEKPAETAAREVCEETGISGPPEDLGYVRDFRIERKYMGGDGRHPWINREYAFALEVTGEPELTLSGDEHDEYLWLDPPAARERLKWNGNKRALDRLESRIAA